VLAVPREGFRPRSFHLADYRSNPNAALLSLHSLRFHPRPKLDLRELHFPLPRPVSLCLIGDCLLQLAPPPSSVMWSSIFSLARRWRHTLSTSLTRSILRTPSITVHPPWFSPGFFLCCENLLSIVVSCFRCFLLDVVPVFLRSSPLAVSEVPKLPLLFFTDNNLAPRVFPPPVALDSSTNEDPFPGHPIPPV